MVNHQYLTEELRCGPYISLLFPSGKSLICDSLALESLSSLMEKMLPCTIRIEHHWQHCA